MKYAENYVRSSTAIITEYKGDIPLAAFLKMHFAANKKFGSKDRKYISQLCYNYFRLGHAVADLSKEDRIKIALFLCNDSIGEWGELFDEYWQSNWSEQLSTRMEFVQSIYSTFLVNAIFPFQHLISKQINYTSFSLSHCIQPDLFIRVRPSKTAKVEKLLEAANLPFNKIETNAISLPNGTKLDTIVSIDEDLVIQDLSSQHVRSMLEIIKSSHTTNTFSVWDTCAASGGKSILAFDVLGKIELTVSDIRNSILHNLHARLSRAGISTKNAFVIDLSKPINLDHTISNQSFDIVICDAPCSGSGTWGRTPEHLSFFDEKKVNLFQQLQQHIVTNIFSSVKKGGYLLYITCSVFEAENEQLSDFIAAKSGFQLIDQKIIEGYTQKADTMYVALFQH